MIDTFNLKIDRSLEQSVSNRKARGVIKAFLFLRAAQTVAITGQKDETCQETVALYPTSTEAWIKLFGGYHSESITYLERTARAKKMVATMSRVTYGPGNYCVAVELALYEEQRDEPFAKYRVVFAETSGDEVSLTR